MRRFFSKHIFYLISIVATAENLSTKLVTPPSLNNDQTSKDFSRAVELLEQGQENESEVSFSDFLRRHPEHPLCDNAVYWLAEINFRRHKYAEAVTGFMKVLKYKDLPGDKSDAIPISIVRMSEALLKIGKRREAIIELEALVRRYPQSEGAQEAQIILAGLIHEKS